MAEIDKRLPKPDLQEVATTLNGRDITIGYVDALPLLPYQDMVLVSRGGSYRIYEELLRDDQVAACFAQRRLALIGSDWEVIPGGDAPIDKLAAEFMEEQLNALDFDDITDKMMFGIFYGFAVAEPIWATDGKYVVAEDIKVRRQRRFGFAPDGSLRLLTMQYPLGMPVPERKFWVYRSGGDHTDNPYGLGLAHSVYWPAFFKRNNMKFWLIFLDKFGMPTAKGEYPTTADAAEKATLLQALQAIQTDSGVVVPSGFNIDLIEAKRSGTADYSKLYETMDDAISKVILGQSASIQGTPGRLGSEDLHQEVRRDIVKADGDLICGSFNRQIGRWLTEWNFPGAKTPIVRRITDEPEDIMARAERDSTIAGMGFRPTLKYITEMYGGEWVPDQPAGTPGSKVTAGTQTPAAFAEGDESKPDRMDMLTDQLDKQSSSITDEMVDRARKLLGEVSDLHEFGDRLIELMGDNADAKHIADLAAKAFSVADLQGRADVDQES